MIKIHTPTVSRTKAKPSNAGQRLIGKVCFITGAGGGIGRATALAMAREGARVVATDIDHAAAQDTAEAIGNGALALEHDVAEEAAWEESLKVAQRTFGGLDVLVNNAGVALGGPIADLKLEDWRWMMSINLDGLFLGTKHGIRALRRRGGAIVNVCSALATRGRPLTGAVAASKAGALSLTRTAALECAARGHQVRVNAVLPGGVDTPIFKGQGWWPDHRAHARREAHARRDIVADTPMGRMARSVEIADAIIFLASDEASFVTGASLAVDGGLTAG
jgi:NAD(P)-dependent dehydrogenase (short-subunit alcohol dehydrogenase family)